MQISATTSPSASPGLRNNGSTPISSQTRVTTSEVMARMSEGTELNISKLLRLGTTIWPNMLQILSELGHALTMTPSLFLI